MEPPLPGLIGLSLLLLLNAFFSAAQAALSNVRRQTLRERAEHGDQRAWLVATLTEDSSRLLLTFDLASLLSRFLIAGLIALLALPLLETFGRWIPVWPQAGYLIGLLIAVPVALLIHLLTELLPETLAQQNAERWALGLGKLAQVTIWAFSPLVRLMTTLRKSLITPLGPDLEPALVTEEKIMTLVDAGEEEGAIEQQEKEMIYSIFRLDETLAREIMVPRIDIVAIEIDTPLEEARRVIIKAGHSRIPVYTESLDHIEGLLYAKDLLEVWDRREEQAVDLRSLLRPALFVPESKRVLDLLRELQAAKVHLAIVIDEYGGTAGLVTIEDVVEEIVGEILDEYDYGEESLYEETDEGEFIVDARIDLDDFNRLLNVELPDEMGDTLGGFIYARLGKVPEPGEVIETENLHIKVLEVVSRRIRKVHVKRLSPARELLPGKGRDRNGHTTNGNNR
ncbi:MAG TPA: HlyC/CorC family transporter [Chloroflexi bacterium]|nr:HlyC/CorC family transporter [Chloroflexota bacterium]